MRQLCVICLCWYEPMNIFVDSPTQGTICVNCVSQSPKDFDLTPTQEDC